ncbi:MAG: hypothetical protein ACFFCF_01270 [Promethearchaeota archaeon]
MSSLLFALLLIASYSLVGGAIKVLDQLTDHPESYQSRHIYLWLLTVILVILVNICVFLDVYTAVLAIGVILGLIVTHKVDNRYFVVLTITILPLSILRVLGFAFTSFILLTLLAVFIASLFDELLHEKASKVSTTALHTLLTYRPILKILVLILPFWNLLTFIHTLGFWGFDFAYELVAYYFRASSLPEA